MADLKFYINGVETPPPDNWEAVDIEVNFESTAQLASIKSGTYEWLGVNAKTLNTWLQGGLFSAPGIFEGTPFQIIACGNVVVFDGCIDMTTTDTTFQCDIVKASVKETNRTETVLESAEGFTFAYLGSDDYHDAGVIRPADFVNVPYVISTIPDWLQVVTLIVTFIEMVKLAKDAITHATELTEAAVAAYPAVGLIFFYGVQAALAIIFAAYIIDLGIKVLKFMFNEIVQPIKFKYGMRVRDLFIKGCLYLGLTFSSTIFETAPFKDLVYIPAKNAYFNNTESSDDLLNAVLGSDITRKKYSDTDNTYAPFGSGSAFGWYDGTFAQFISEMCDYFNAKVVMVDSVMHFERFDFWDNSASFVIPDISSEAPFQDPYGTNASELSSNYFIQYQTDSSDQNTQDKYDGTSCQMTMLPNVVNVQKNVLLKGLTEKNFNFALAKRKEVLTTPERIIQKMVNLLNDVGFSLDSDFINDRLGAMLLSTDMTAVPKMLVVESDPILWIDGIYGNNVAYSNSSLDHKGYTDAYFIMRCFHAASWGVAQVPTSEPSNATSFTIPGSGLSPSFPNQYLTYKDKEIPLCCSDFKRIKGNNIIITHDLKPGKIDSMRWNPFNETAIVTYRVKQVYTKNLVQSIIVDGTYKI